MFLEVAIVVVRIVARPHHLPHCNVAVVFPREHFQSSTVVYFLRRDSTCRGVFSLRGLPELLPRHFVYGCLATMFCHMRFCNWSRSTRKNFLPPFPNSRRCGHSAVTTRLSNGNLATDFLPIDFTLHHCHVRLLRCSHLSHGCRSTWQWRRLYHHFLRVTLSTRTQLQGPDSTDLFRVNSVPQTKNTPSWLCNRRRAITSSDLCFFVVADLSSKRLHGSHIAMAVLSLCNPFRIRVKSHSASSRGHGTMLPSLFSTCARYSGCLPILGMALFRISARLSHGSFHTISSVFPWFSFCVTTLDQLHHASVGAWPCSTTLCLVHINWLHATLHNGVGTGHTILPHSGLSVLSFPWTVQVKLSQTCALLLSFRCGPWVPSLHE